MKVITFFNNKGGVGKTTLTVNIASYIKSELGKTVLVVDADPQANTTQMVIPAGNWGDFYSADATRKTIKDIFLPIIEGDSNIDTDIQVVRGSENKFLFDLIPGHPTLSAFEDVLSDAWNKSLSADIGGLRKTNWLNVLINHVSDQYEYLIIDVGPSLGALNRSILLNSEFIVTPMGSDIFSIMGISNIAEWIKGWQDKYKVGISLVQDQSIFERFHIRRDVDTATRIAGYSVQQYNARKYKKYEGGKRPVRAYDEIISEIYPSINRELSSLIVEGVSSEDRLNLGDIPYLNSIIPIAQSNNCPIFALTAREGVRGNQSANVTEYKEMLSKIVTNLLQNVNDSDSHNRPEGEIDGGN
jgi:cellulose biosynthesis protein BcsQ